MTDQLIFTSDKKDALCVMKKLNATFAYMDHDHFFYVKHSSVTSGIYCLADDDIDYSFFHCLSLAIIIPNVQLAHLL